MFAVKTPAASSSSSSSSTKKPRKTAIDMEDEEEEPEDLDPMDLLVDVLIGFLERASSQLRALASQVFGMLSGEVTESTVDLLLAVSSSFLISLLPYLPFSIGSGLVGRNSR